MAGLLRMAGVAVAVGSVFSSMGLSSDAALAQEAGQGQALFFRFDSDRDGEIDFAEFKDAHRYRFLAADRDGDHEVTASEWFAVRPSGWLRADRATELYRQLDADASGTLTASEFNNAAGWWFDQLDLDANNVLTLNELGPPWRIGGGGATEGIPGR